MMKIRRGNEGDITKLARLWRDMVKELEPYSIPNVDWWKAATLQHMRYNKEYVCFVAEIGQTIVGFADFVLIVEPSTNKAVAVAKHMYTKPEERGKKIGYFVKQTCMEMAKIRGATQMLFETTDPEKWKRHGFEVVRSVMGVEL
jgi:predicted N-acetyltransferase YhbS